ncbi:MAG: FAD-binding oxidoreductase, partial [Deltaproteobacteria bacterium]|nr:FAD-binding oxidoreductase [Deltaproteobacteria bacterium]
MSTFLIPLRPAQASPKLIERLARIVGPDHLSIKDPDRFAYSRDLWPKTLMWLMEGKALYPPDVIIWPENVAQVGEILRLAAREGIPVTPLGAGSGICAAAMAINGGIIMDLKRMNRVIAIDKSSMVAEVEPGIIGWHLESILARFGLTMGHFPSSITCSTVGGYLATRSAGQMSSKYGKIEDIVASLEVVLADGRLIRTPFTAGRRYLPDLNQVFTGSEGTLGVITRAWMKVHPVPTARDYLGFHFYSLDHALMAMQDIMQAGVRPAVLRLYDEFDTVVASSKTGRSSSRQAPWLDFFRLPKELISKVVTSAVLKRPRLLNRLSDYLPGKFLFVVVCEGTPQLVAHETATIKSICAAHDGHYRGKKPAENWYQNRYALPFKQSSIFYHHGFVDTMDIATTWDEAINIYYLVREAVSDHMFIMAHFTHPYPDGVCISFTMIGPANALDIYDLAWTKGLEAVLAGKGSLAHHHGVGFSKQGFLADELQGGLEVYRGIKEYLDKDWILNPNKMGLGADGIVTPRRGTSSDDHSIRSQ